ncbi:hypothetical protein, partial [Xanthovirga aplysinae]|uniref:hypothetical protein n=1 Tax=Xanthovirga aplysinae TaxID=2529853 RepID=UPI0016575817
NPYLAVDTSTDANKLRIGARGQDILYVSASGDLGKLGINVETPQEALDINGNVKVSGQGRFGRLVIRDVNIGDDSGQVIDFKYDGKLHFS